MIPTFPQISCGHRTFFFFFISHVFGRKIYIWNLPKIIFHTRTDELTRQLIWLSNESKRKRKYRARYQTKYFATQIKWKQIFILTTKISKVPSQEKAQNARIFLNVILFYFILLVSMLIQTTKSSVIIVKKINKNIQNIHEIFSCSKKAQFLQGWSVS